MTQVHHALFELGSTRPLHLCADDATARRLYSSCKATGLLADQTVDALEGPALERLHQLFDVALQNNLASYICHCKSQRKYCRFAVKPASLWERRRPV